MAYVVCLVDKSTRAVCFFMAGYEDTNATGPAILATKAVALSNNYKLAGMSLLATHVKIIANNQEFATVDVISFINEYKTR